MSLGPNPGRGDFVTYTSRFSYHKQMLKEEVKIRCWTFGELCQGKVRERMRKAGGGIEYPGRRPAGAPGGYPAKQTGDLISSINHIVRDKGDHFLIGFEFTDPEMKKLAMLMETGGKWTNRAGNTVVFPARPWYSLFVEQDLYNLYRKAFKMEWKNKINRYAVGKPKSPDTMIG